jgi:predicted phosphate transport protein (TIGR00153 family)
MSLNNIFQYFIPKDKKFFPLFEEAANNLIELGNSLKEVVNTDDLGRRKELFKHIEDLEHKGDTITHQIYLELGKNFITPFDREDIHELASAIDDVADYIHGSANRMNLYQVVEMTDSIKELADLILEAVTVLAKAINELKNLKNIRTITDACIKINSIENKADYVFDKAVGDLFEFEKDAIRLIKYKEVLSALETATDMCEDVTDVLETILVKNA